MNKLKLALLLITLTLTTFSGTFNLKGEDKVKNVVEVPTRQQIEERYKWNLNDFYPDKAAWEKDFSWCEKQFPAVKALKGTLGKSDVQLLKAIKQINEVEKKVGLVNFYASSMRDLDLTDATAQNLYNKANKLSSDFSTDVSWFSPELMSIPEAKLKGFLAKNKELAEFKHLLDKILMMKEHTLSADQEELLAKVAPIGDVASETYGILNNTELQFPTVKDPNGNEIRISHALYGAALSNPDRQFRHDVYKGIYVPYTQLKNTMASLYNGRVRQRIIDGQVRNFKSPLEASLFQNNIPVEVYDNLIKTARDNFPIFHRWANIKKRVLKLKELHPYDQYVSLFPGVPKTYTFDEGMALCLAAFKPLGKEYCDAVKKCYDNRWIDVYETKGKRSGAYSNSCMSVHPLVLLNWGGQLNDVFTLAHELGHNMHSFFSEKNQPYQYAHYPIFLAEIASTTNEAILLDYLIKNATTKEEKLSLIEKFLINAQQTFHRQTRFADFEKVVHEKALAGDYLSADQLTELFGKMYSEYWGPAMTVDPEEGISWARIPHLTNYNFYVYQYATGFAAAQAISEKIISEGQPAVDRYLKNFLYAGNTAYPMDILKNTGVDMTTPDPIIKTCKKFERYLDELEKLMAE